MNEVDHKIKILIVDDMPEIRRIIRHVLERSLHAELIEAENGLDAISKLLETKVDVIITDLSMPSMTGLEFIGFVQHRDDLKATPIVVLTSQTDERVQVQALGLNVRTFLQKPFNPQKLLNALANVVHDRYFIRPTKE